MLQDVSLPSKKKMKYQTLSYSYLVSFSFVFNKKAVMCDSI